MVLAGRPRPLPKQAGMTCQPGLAPVRRAGSEFGCEGEWLVADIGGTHARLSRWTPTDGLETGSRRTYRNDRFSDIASILCAYRADLGVQTRQVVLALAAPIGARRRIRLTNRDWVLVPAELRSACHLTRLLLVNDLVAAASGLGTLEAHEIANIGGVNNHASNALVVSVGTGLGVGIAFSACGATCVLSSEAGHMSAAPDGDEGRAVCRRAENLFGRASWERLLSGSGLELFDAVIRKVDQPSTAAEVAARARAGDAQALRAARAFSRALGQFAGDLCLAVGANARVYFTGGVLLGLAETLDVPSLRSGFEDKGRFAQRLRGVECLRVKCDELAERGLGLLLAGSVRAAVIEA